MVLTWMGVCFCDLISVATFGHYMSLVAMCSLIGNCPEILWTLRFPGKLFSSYW